jgi:tight adherence protein C
MQDTVTILLVWLVGVLVVYFGLSWWKRLQTVRRRLFEGQDVGPRIDAPALDDSDSWLTRWLMLAGFRAPGATATFLLSAGLCLVVGVSLAILLAEGGPLEFLQRRLEVMPATVIAIVMPMLVAAPWILGAFIVALPWMVVRSARQERVLEIERGLPTSLDLLATLSETGMGFDAALSKIVDHEKTGGALKEELQIFQLETLAGVSRSQCFRRLARRCEVSSMTIFCAALVQAEQVGAGFSQVLRHQAEDLRSRRRERAMILAQALPVKLVFPLVICFLPGIFLTTIGPAFLELSGLIDGLVRG